MTDGTMGRFDYSDQDAAIVALNKIAAACGCPQWDYPGQVVRDVLALAKERDELRMRCDLAGAQLSMVASEICGDSKLHWQDRTDPRWTPTLQEAWALRQKTREDAAQIVALVKERDELRMRVVVQIVPRGDDR